MLLVAGSVESKRRTCVAEEEMERLRVEERLALGPHARLDVFESAQLCVLPDVNGNLYDDKTARNKERTPYAVDEKHGEHPVRHNEILLLF